MKVHLLSCMIVLSAVGLSVGSGVVRPAHADEETPLDVQLIVSDPNLVPVPGDIVRATLELSSEVPLVVTGVDVQSGRDAQGNRYWEPALIDLPADLLLSPGVPQSFAVELLAGDPLQMLEIVVMTDAGTVQYGFYVIAPADPGGVTLPPTVSVVGDPLGQESPPVAGDPAISLWQSPAPYQLPAGKVGVRSKDSVDVDQKSESAGKKSGLVFEVKGRLVYTRKDGVVIGVDGATVFVYDSDPFSDNDTLLGTGVTSANGNFDFNVFSFYDSNPTIYCVFYAANSVVNVKYSWALSSVSSFSNTWSMMKLPHNSSNGTVVDLGTVSASGLINPAFHILSTITKTWRYLGGLGYTSQLARVRVSFPSGTDISLYRHSLETVFITFDDQWQEPTIIHEFGHHWLDTYGNPLPPDYCNPGGYGDESQKACGHRLWCDENSDVAWSEGFPQFLADVTTQWITDNYFPTIGTWNLESIQVCDVSNQNGDPYKVEGIAAALMRDLADGTGENDPAFGSLGSDRVYQGVASVLGVASGATTPGGIRPSNVTSFLNIYGISHPGLGWRYWATARNNGYGLDTQPPGTPVGLTSTSHSTVGDSPDGTVDLVWSTPTDDMSGVDQYIVEAANTPVYPAGAGSWGVTGATSTTTPDLAPGTWYITVVAVDRSGKWSANYATFGPVTIRPPEPADFAVANSGRAWSAPLIPRKTDDATATYAPLPAWLPGDQPETWFNYRVENSGELSNLVTVSNWVFLDGVLLSTNSIPITQPLGGGAHREFINQGPFTVRGGRHNVVVHTDATEVMPETNEVDNRYRQQFIWAPTVLVSSPADRAAPPDPYGGFTATQPFISTNCDGLAFPGLTAPFTGLAVVPDVPGEDVDVRSFSHTTGPEDGFGLFGTLAGSSRPASAVDAVITNTSTNPGLVVDAGIYRIGDMTGGYRAFPLASTNLPTGVETQITLAAGQYISLHDFLVSTNFGSQYGTIRVSVPQGTPSLWAALIPPEAAHFGLDDATVVGSTSRSGMLSLNFTYTAPQHCLVLYRDRPADGSEPAAMTATVWVGPTPANYLAATGLAGWAAPLVPTDGAAGTSSSVPSPTTLTGDVPSTYLNAAIANNGPNPAVPLIYFTMIDGTSSQGVQASGIVAGGTHTHNFTIPVTVRGGRHSLWMVIDPDDDVDESDEADNVWGRQWVWQPSLLSTGPAVDFTAPDDPIGGMDAVVSAQQSTFYLNCVGLRDPAPLPSGNDGQWRAVVVMPGSTSDVDVRLYDVDLGATNGYRDVLISSNWGVGQSDYVLTDFRAVSAKPMDIGVVSVQGTEDFMAQSVQSTFLGTKPTGAYGDFTLGDRELLALHEVELEAGLTVIDLTAVSGNVDWGMTLHRVNLPYHSKSNSSWVASANGPGSGESLIVDVPEAGFYCLAVWKAGSADATLTGTYRLSFTIPTAVPPVQPVVQTRLRSVQPNPFNPRTVVTFDLLRSGPVGLRVFDLRGGLVRTLVDEVRTAGRHEVTWEGLDDRGHRVASGVYFVALEAQGVRDVRKAVLVK